MVHIIIRLYIELKYDNHVWEPKVKARSMKNPVSGSFPEAGASYYKL